MEGHTGAIWAPLVWSPDAKRIVSAGRDGSVRMWDAASGREMPLLGHFQGAVTGLSWSSDGGKVAAAGPVDGVIKIWDASKGYEYAGSIEYGLDCVLQLVVKGQVEDAATIFDRLAAELSDADRSRLQKVLDRDNTVSASKRED